MNPCVGTMNNIVQKLSTTSIMNELILKRIRAFTDNPTYTNYAQMLKFGVGLYVVNSNRFRKLECVDLKELDCSGAVPLYNRYFEIYGLWVSYKRANVDGRVSI